MKKRNVIIATAVTAIIGSGIAFAGAKSCHYKNGHQNGQFGGHKIERIMSKLDRHLDLTDQQEIALKEIFESNQSVLKAAGQSRAGFRAEIMGLDPSSSDYDAAVAALADQMAVQVKQHTVAVASVVKQVAGILTKEQIEEAREMIGDRMEGMARRHHGVDDDEDSN